MISHSNTGITPSPVSIIVTVDVESVSVSEETDEATGDSEISETHPGSDGEISVVDSGKISGESDMGGSGSDGVTSSGETVQDIQSSILTGGSITIGAASGTAAGTGSGTHSLSCARHRLEITNPIKIHATRKYLSEKEKKCMFNLLENSWDIVSIYVEEAL